VAAFDCRHIALALFGGEIISHFLRGFFVENDFGISARDKKRARESAESSFHLAVNFKEPAENFAFKVGNFFEKMTRFAVVVRVEKRKDFFVPTGDKGEVIFVFTQLTIK
jgi:hypothetical protein